MDRISQRSRQMADLWTKGVKTRIIADTFGVTPPTVMKALRRVGVLPPYKSGIKRLRNAAPPRRPLPTPVHRDPCPRCGIRADIGCSHGWGNR